MATGRTNSGVGGGAIYAVISVTYPAGSICTCSNGTKTLTAKDTSGSYVFNVPSTGTWTIQCTDGTSSTSKSVEITEKYQAESVELIYSLYLYTPGNEHTDVTGGFVAKAAKSNSSSSSTPQIPSVTRGSTELKMSETGRYRAGMVYTQYGIDITKYSKLRIQGNVYFSQAYSGYGMKVYSAIGTYYDDNVVLSSGGVGATAGVRKTYDITLDISNISGSYYFGFTMQSGEGSSETTEIVVTNMWLEV